MRHISKIIIHCSATPAGRHVTARDITRWHIARGFRTIGYHYIIMLDGTVVEGRSIEQVGAHCLGHNRHSLGICYVGGTDADGKPCDTRTPAQRSALVKLVNRLRARFPHAEVFGHNELTCKQPQNKTRPGDAPCSRQCTHCKYAAKACPSFNVKNEPDLCEL